MSMISTVLILEVFLGGHIHLTETIANSCVHAYMHLWVCVWLAKAARIGCLDDWMICLRQYILANKYLSVGVCIFLLLWPLCCIGVKLGL